MLPLLPLVAQAPTNVMWWALLRYYLFLGFAAGSVVTVIMLYWIVKYRSKGDVKSAPQYHHEDESGWGNWKSVVLTLLVTGGVLAFVEYQTFANDGLVNPPVTNGDPLYISVTGQQFAWSFTYPNGYLSVGNLTVPSNEIVILNITSIDVDHSFSIDSLSVAKDAIPGEHNFIWFNATQTGTWVDGIRCKELCGVGHADMLANFTVASPSAYSTWYASVTHSNSSTTTSVSGNGQTQVINIPQGAGGAQELNFSPSTVSVTAGTTIQWVDQDTTAIHNVHFLSGPSGATLPGVSPNLSKGSTFQVTLTTPGTYKYQCDYHNAWMQGTITVTG